MPGVWQLSEARLVQERTKDSAADADTVSFSTTPVPQGKCWIVLACAYVPSAAETRLVSFYKVTGSGAPLVLLNPVSIALNPARATFIEQGMEYLLLPGEYILARRDAHTAGSTMSITIQIIEIDLPLYTYDEPQVVKRQVRALSSIRTQLGGGLGGPGSRGPIGPGDTGGRRGGPLEK